MNLKNELACRLGIFLIVMAAIFVIIMASGFPKESQPNEPDEAPAVEQPQDATLEEEEDVQRFESLGMFDSTAYCPCVKCCGKSDGITASGTKAVAGRTVAADPSYLPIGTKVYVGGNEYTVEDTGYGINKKRIDIFFDNHDEALMYGRQQVEVFVSW